MKKNSSKQTALYVALFGVLALVVVYFLVYKAYMDKAEQIRTSNISLTARVDELKKYYDDLDFYNGEIEMMEAQIFTWLDAFPADVLEEDILVLALDTEKVAWVDYSNINMGTKEALKVIPAETVLASGMEELQQEIIFVNRTTSYVNSVDYENLKDVVKEINAQDNRLNISNIAYGRNTETGLLEGTIEVTFYSVIGTGKEYVPQKLKDYRSGLEDLFNISHYEGNLGE